MIFEHEIPGGSHLYFGKSAAIKRDIETKAANLLIEEGQDLNIYPDDIAAEFSRMYEATQKIGGDAILSPLYYGRPRYYDSLLLRMLADNNLFVTGGTYKIDSILAAGFALYTDACMAQLISKDKK